MAVSVPQVSVSILDTQLRLVHIPRDQLERRMWELTRFLWFRENAPKNGNGPKDSFFNLTLNSVEVSLFAHADVVDKIFGTDSGSREREELANGRDMHGTSAVREIMERSDGIEIGDALWVALQIEQHEGDWGAAGKRVKEISAPLAAEGISILFLSTYISDFILIKERRLSRVIQILHASGFFFHHSPDDPEFLVSPHPSPSPMSPPAWPVEESDSPLSPQAPPQSGSRQGSVDRSPFRPPIGAASRSVSMTGSLLLNDRSSAGSGSSPGTPLMNGIGIEGKVASPPPAVRRNHSGSIDSVGGLRLSRGSSLGPAAISEEQNLLSCSPLAAQDSSTTLAPETNERGNVDDDVEATDALPPPADLPPSHTAPEAASLPDAHPRSFPEEMERSRSSIPDLMMGFGSGQKLTILSDELVCVGLNAQYEMQWRDKLLRALFFVEDVLPRPESPAGRGCSYIPSSPSIDRRGFEGLSNGVPIPASTATERPRHNSVASSESSTLDPAANYPTPFFSLTQTLEGTSLTSDIRVLRKLFTPEEESNMIYVGGQGGLSGLFAGEGSTMANGFSKFEDRGRSPIRKRTYANEEVSEGGDWDVDPDVLTEDTEGGDSRQDDEGDGDDDDAGNGWNRSILKVLQLDLSSFGLDKHGIVNRFADTLTRHDINLLYCSTFKTANILVSKRDLRKARRVLQGRI